MPKGDCYKANGNAMYRYSDWTLVHGEVVSQQDKKRFGHCWLEKGDQVMDFSNNRELKVNKAVYYAIGQIRKTYKYNFKEFIAKITEYEHWGPWPPNNPSR